jgi:DNA-binding response OmpR family regulator
MAHILVIDDDEQVLVTLQEVVEALGHRVRTAADGKAGLELFEREEFDCVITDLAMPEVDGLTVLRRVKRKRPDIGVLVITGNSTVDLLAASVNMGVDAYVTKPFKISELDEQLSRILAAHPTRQRLAAPAAVPANAIERAANLRVPIAWAILAAIVAIVVSRLVP